MAMQFLYSADAGKDELEIQNEGFLHLKSRRVKLNSTVCLRNLQDDFIYKYEIKEVQKKSIKAFLLDKSKTLTKKSGFSLALAMIEPKILEKTLPFLNEMGLDKLILVYTKFSQRNFKLDLKRCERILISSCEQCGRTYLMQIELFENVDLLCEKYNNIVLLDFDTKNYIENENLKNKIIFVGCEGGFSKEERELFTQKVSFKTKNILRAQSAAIAVCAKILL